MINRYPLLKVFCIRNDSMRDQNEDSVACSDGNLRSPLAHLECMDPSWSKQKRYGGVLKYGYPKSSTLRGFSIVNYPRYGVFPFLKTPRCVFFHFRPTSEFTKKGVFCLRRNIMSSPLASRKIWRPQSKMDNIHIDIYIYTVYTYILWFVQ